MAMTKYKIYSTRQDSAGNAVEWAIYATNYYGASKSFRSNSRKRIKRLCGHWFFTTLQSAQNAYNKLPAECKE